MAKNIEELRSMSDEELLDLTDGYTCFCFNEEIGMYNAHYEDIKKALKLDREEMLDAIAAAEKCRQNEDSICNVVNGATNIVEDHERGKMLDSMKMPTLVSLCRDLRKNLSDFFFKEEDVAKMNNILKELEHSFAVGYHGYFEMKFTMVDKMKLMSFILEAVQDGKLVMVKDMNVFSMTLGSYVSEMDYSTEERRSRYELVDSIAVKNHRS